MLRFTLLLAALSCTTGQLLQRCPNYQTTVNFTQQFADQMQKRAGGYIVRLSNGATDACQRLQFVDGNDFNFTFIDVANFKRNYTNRHSVKTAESTSPAMLSLTMHPRLFGADNRGSLKLYPLVAHDDVVAFVSCIERGLALFITEQVLVFTPYESKENLTDNQIKSVLNHNKVPRVDELKNISTNCVPKPSAVPHPISLDLYNLVSNLMNPFGGVSPLAVTYGGPNQNPVDAAGHVMSIFKQAGVSPAQFYAQTGSTIMQNMSPTGAQSYFDYQNPMYYNSQPAYYDNALSVAQSAANAEHFYNHNPGYPTQYNHHNANPQTPTQAAGVPTNVMSIGVAPHATSHGFGMSAAEYATGNVNKPTGSVQNPSGSVYNPSATAYNPTQTSYNQMGKTHHQTGNYHNVHNIPAHGNYPNNNNFYPTGSNQAHYNY